MHSTFGEALRDERVGSGTKGSSGPMAAYGCSSNAAPTVTGRWLTDFARDLRDPKVAFAVNSAFAAAPSGVFAATLTAVTMRWAWTTLR